MLQHASPMLVNIIRGHSVAGPHFSLSLFPRSAISALGEISVSSFFSV